MNSAAQRVRRREQRESTRREILAAAERFLRSAPLRDLSVEAVMAETGLTRTAFYRHFDDVTALLLRLLSDLGTELYAVAERWAGQAYVEHPVAAHERLSDIVDFFVTHGPLVRAISEAAATDEQIEQAYRSSLETFVDITARVLEERVAGGELEAPDTRALARALTLMNQAYLLEEFGREPAGDPAVALATLETVWLRVAGPGGASS